MRRLPILPTLIVIIAVPIMLGFGIWQLNRAEWKEALLDRLAANATAPLIAKPASFEGRVDELSFRRVRTVCQEIRPWLPSAARAATGGTGYRQAIWCSEGRGDPVLVSLGVATDPSMPVTVPAGSTFVGPLVPRDARAPGDPSFLLVAEMPVPPLAKEAPPTVDSVPNNHLAYAVQWFLFAATLLVIYVIYLRRRGGASA